MKKFVICVATMLLTSTAAFSQMEKVKQAKKASSGETPDFAMAENIMNEVIANPETKNSAEAWYTKGLIFSKQFDFEDDKRYQVPPQRPDVEIQSRAAYMAYEAWIVADSLDKVESINNPKRKGKLKYRGDISKKLANMKNYLPNYGEIMFNSGDFEKASEIFENVIKLPTLPMFEGSDKITASDSIFYYAKENDQLAMKQQYFKVFAERDTVAAEKVLMKGKSTYPTNSFFLTYMIQHDMWANREKEAMQNLNEAIAQNPQNFVFYLVRGNIYSIKSENRELARADYNKALELKSDFYEAYVALADLCKMEGDNHYNNAMDLEMKKPREAQVENTNATKKYQEAVSILEKVRTLKTPVDDAILQSLQGLYRKLKMYDKEKEIRAARGL